MRERRPEDWRADLATRHPLERHVEGTIATHGAFAVLNTSTASLRRLDFQVIGPGERLVEIELKAKRQRYVGWSNHRHDVPEARLFILDELAFRKIVEAGRYGVLLVHDAPSRRWLAWTVGDLLLVTKVRVNRPLATGGDRVKAKLLLDLDEAPISRGDLGQVLDALAQELALVDERWLDIGPWRSNRSTQGEVA